MRGILSSVFALFCLGSAAEGAPMHVDRSLTELPVGRHVEYYRDAGGTIPFATVKNSAGLHWVKSRVTYLGFGFTRSVYWLRFTVVNDTGADIPFFLEQSYPLIDDIDLYCPDDGRGYRRIRAGDFLPFSKRPFEHRTFVFPLVQKARSTSTCYMRFQSTSSMSLPLTIWEPDTFRRKIQREDRLLMLFYGMILVLIIYNLLVFAAIRQRVFLFYVLFMASFMAFIMMQQGTAFQFLWPAYPGFANACIPVTLAIVILLANIYARHFLSTGMKYGDTRLVFRMFVVITWAGLVFSLLAFSRSLYIVAMAGTALLSVLAILGGIYISVRLTIKKVRSAYFYLSGWLFFFFGSGLYIAKTFDLVAPSFVTSWSILFGAALMMVVLSIAQADLLNIMWKKLSVLSTDLEEKVKERTEELESVNRRLHEANDKLETAQMIADLDIRMASNLQMNLLPRNMPAFNGWDFACDYLPMKGVSGDFYDVYHAGGSLHGIALFDVSGHGIASGLLTILAKSILYRHFHQDAYRGIDEIMRHFNEDLVAEIKDVDNYLTGILLRMVGDSIEYVNAGHVDLLLRSGDTGRVERERPGGRTFHTGLLGIDGTENRFDVMRFKIKTGDMILLVSDGVTECKNGGRETFGEERLARAFENAPRGSARAVIDYIMERVADFNGGVPAHDDVTIMVLLKKG